MSLTKKASVLAFAFVLILVSLVPIVSGQNQDQSGGSGLQISPTRTEIVAQPGEQKDFTITVRNITKGDLVAQVVLNDFESDGVSGTPKIIVEDQASRTPYSLFNMLKNLQTVELKPNEVKEVKLKIDVPGDTAPGAYFGAIRYAATPKGQQLNEAQRQVALTASVAHLVFVEIPGNIVEQIKIENLVMQNGNTKGSFFFKAPNSSNLTVKNLGNGFSRPFGKVTIDRALGGEVYSYDVNNRDPRGIILPNSTRVFTDDVKNIKIPGKYTTTASVAYGSGGEVVNFKSSFWYIPIWFIIALIIFIGLIVGGTTYVYRKKYTFKKSNKK